MSKYTTELRFICESKTETGGNQSHGYSDIDDIVKEASPIIFENYPIFDENYRLPLNKKILKHYYTREICEETYALWKLRLNTRMEEIMPYYNKLYTSELIQLNPLNEVDLTTESSNTGGSTRTNKSTSESSNAYSDTPQGTISGVENNSYLSNYAKANFEGNDVGSITDTNAYVEHVVGKNSSKSNSKLLQEFRETFLNIDKMIIDELSDLFFGLWD